MKPVASADLRRTVGKHQRQRNLLFFSKKGVLGRGANYPRTLAWPGRTHSISARRMAVPACGEPGASRDARARQIER
jgi:hypothetical protein